MNEKPLFDWTLSIGNLIGVAAMLIGFFWALSVRMRAMETKVESMWNWFIGQMPDLRDNPGRRRVDSIYEAVRRRDKSLTDDDT
jgi:hypothetical protein